MLCERDEAVGGGGPGGGGGNGIPGSHLDVEDVRDLDDVGVLIALADTARREAGGLELKLAGSLSGLCTIIASFCSPRWTLLSGVTQDMSEFVCRRPYEPIVTCALSLEGVKVWRETVELGTMSGDGLYPAAGEDRILGVVCSSGDTA